jgi:nitroreductase
MDTFECISSKFEVREFSKKQVPFEIRMKILEAARLTGSGLNTQHWRFIVIEDKERLKKLADDSMSGKWVIDANFAIIILTNPKYSFHLIDAGRVLQNMQMAAWNYGIGSGLYTKINESMLKRDFEIPDEFTPSVILGFGYPAKNFTNKTKDRLPIDKLVYNEQYGKSINKLQ